MFQEDPLRTQSRDTDHRVEREHVMMLRRAGASRRLELVRSLCATAIDASREGIRRRNPSFSDLDVNLRFVELCYGSDLANRVKDYLQRGAT